MHDALLISVSSLVFCPVFDVWLSRRLKMSRAEAGKQWRLSQVECWRATTTDTSHTFCTFASLLLPTTCHHRAILIQDKGWSNKKTTHCSFTHTSHDCELIFFFLLLGTSVLQLYKCCVCTGMCWFAWMNVGFVWHSLRLWYHLQKKWMNKKMCLHCYEHVSYSKGQKRQITIWAKGGNCKAPGLLAYNLSLYHLIIPSL